MVANLGFNSVNGGDGNTLPDPLMKIPFSKDVSKDIAAILSNSGQPGVLDTKKEYHMIQQYLETKGDSLTPAEKYALEDMLMGFEHLEEQYGNLYHPNVNSSGSIPDAVPCEPEGANESEVETASVEKPSKLQPKDIKAARDNGKNVAEKLFGYTNSSEQEITARTLQDDINSGNILEFLRGYEEYRTGKPVLSKSEKALMPGGMVGQIIKSSKQSKLKDSFFEQMRTECSFPEKESLIRKAAEDLKEYAAKKYGEDSDIATEIAVVLLEESLGEKETQKLDAYALQLLSE